MFQQSPTPTQPDRLVISTSSAPIALSESSLDLVSGGVTVNKAKTADKAYQQIDAYIKG